MKNSYLLLIVFLFIGYASVDPIPFKGPNGKDAYSMKCSGMGRTLDKCFVKAGEVCPNGYNIISQTSGTVAVPVGASIGAAPKQAMAIECK
jgi:hypothetical protein